MRKNGEKRVKKWMVWVLTLLMFCTMTAQLSLGIVEASYNNAEVGAGLSDEKGEDEKEDESSEQEGKSQSSAAEETESVDGTEAEGEQEPESGEADESAEQKEAASSESEEEGEMEPSESGEPAETEASESGEPAETEASESGEPAETEASESGEPAETEASESGEPDETEPSESAEPDQMQILPTDLKIEILGRDGGAEKEGVIFSSEKVVYTIRVMEQTADDGVETEESSDQTSETEDVDDEAMEEETAVIKYKIADFEGFVPVEEHVAEIMLEEECMGLLQLWYECGEVKSSVIEEYLVIEHQAPEVVCERRGEGAQQYAHITITEPGTIQSGIQECRIIMDGEAIEADGMLISAETALANGSNVPVCQEIDIPLTGDLTHDIQIVVSDYAGNVTEKAVTMRAVPEDVSNVILPSSFKITIKPYSEERWQIYSDDIVVQNQNDFPVDVVISRVEVYVNHYVQEEGETTSDNTDGEGNQGKLDPTKNCEINFQLRQGGEEVMFFPLAEGVNEEIPSFSLAAREAETDTSVYAADRKDCAVINLCGVLEAGSEPLWRTGDLTVRLSFRFRRSAAEEETGQEGPVPETEAGLPEDGFQ